MNSYILRRHTLDMASISESVSEGLAETDRAIDNVFCQCGGHACMKESSFKAADRMDYCILEMALETRLGYKPTR